MINILRLRRSIRLFNENPITSEQRELLNESLLRSPTSRGRNPWQFILVDDRQLLERLALAKVNGSAFLAGAKLAYVICGDESVSDVWIEDCTIAAITLHYTAHSLGLGSCWTQIRLRENDEEQSAETYLQKLLNIPGHIKVASIIGVGQLGEEKSGHAQSELPKGKFHHNGYLAQQSRA